MTMKATIKFDREDHERLAYKRRAAHPVKSKRNYSRKDKSWQRWD